jgi:mannose-6-phosphate isomerase
MYPIRFEPIYKDYVWGGKRIAQVFHRKVDLPRVAESWELSDRDEGVSVVMNGPLKGKTLHQLVQEMGEELLGVGRKFERFPLLLKIIDAKENLSIQVHPDEISAKELGGEPKTEMWVILENGTVYAGVKKGVTEKELLKALKAGTAEELLEKVELKKGEAVYIPGGRVHAICAGSLIYEIQQNSNTTYRLYDWGRTGRTLQLKEGMAAINWNDKTAPKIIPRHLSSDLKHQLVVLIFCPFFSVERIDVFNSLHLAAIPKTFQSFFCMEGKAIISVDGNREPFEPGMTYLVPAAARSIDFEGRCQMLRTRLS